MESIAFKKIKNHDIERLLQTIFKNEFNDGTLSNALSSFQI